MEHWAGFCRRVVFLGILGLVGASRLMLVKARIKCSESFI